MRSPLNELKGGRTETFLGMTKKYIFFYPTTFLNSQFCQFFYNFVLAKLSKQDSSLTNDIQMISYKRYFECTLVQWRLSIYPYFTQVAEVPFS